MKSCIKCGAEKPLEEYYKHPQMADGHLNKCKACCREASRQTLHRITTSPEWRERELERHREKARRYREAGRQIETEASRKAKRKWDKNNRHKKAAQIKVNNAVRDGRLTKEPCAVCGSADSEGHHEDYSKPLDVIWYCPKHHAERHVEIRKEARLRKLESLQNLTT